MATKYQLITELYRQTILHVTNNHERWTGFLRAACYNYKCPFDEQILIYAQRPDATAVLELSKWNERFERWVNRGASGIAVLADERGQGRLKYYFDISDTHESLHSRPVPIWTMDAAFSDRVIETLENTFGMLSEKETLVEAVFSAVRNGVADNLTDYLHELRDCRENSLLEELDDINLKESFRRALESSIAFMLLTRLSIPADVYLLPEDFSDIHSFNTHDTINALGIATSDIAEMGLREISRTIFQEERNRTIAKDKIIRYDEKNRDEERREENGADLQKTEWISDPEPDFAARAGITPRRVRRDEETVLNESQESALHQPEDQLPAERTSGGDRGVGQSHGGTKRQTDGESGGRYRGHEGEGPSSLDRTDEQPTEQRRGASAERSDLQLISQESEPKAGSDEKSLPAFLDGHLIEAVVISEEGRNNKRQEIFDFFQEHKDYQERQLFLKKTYMDDFVEMIIDGVRVGYHKEESGLLMWKGHYHSRISESTFSWGIITEMTENLITRGEYRTKLGLQNTPFFTEQLSFFDKDNTIKDGKKETALEPSFSIRKVPRQVIDKLLYTAGNQQNSVYRVVAIYMRKRPEKENVDFLKHEFGKKNGRGIEHEGEKYAAWFMEDGIIIVQGNTIRNKQVKTILSWEEVSIRIQKMLKDGTYLSNEELKLVRNKTMEEMADALIFTARDLSEEGRLKGFFQNTLDIYNEKRTILDCTKIIAEKAHNDEFLEKLAKEYHLFLTEYIKNPSIMRCRLSEYNSHRIGVVLNGCSYEEQQFEAKPNFLRQCKMFITQDEIDSYFLSEHIDSRLDVYSHFCYSHTSEENQKYIKASFGEFSGFSGDGYSYTKNRRGIIFERYYSRKKYDSVELSISNVVKNYEQLISQNSFPGEDAIAKIPEYELVKLARSVYQGFYGASHEITRPYKEGTDFYDAISLIQQQLSDPTKTREILSSLAARLDTTLDGDRYYDSVKTAYDNLSEYVAGTFSLFNHSHGQPIKESTFVKQVIEAVVEKETAESQSTQEGATLASPGSYKKEITDAAAPIYPDGINYRITDDALGVGTPGERYKGNVDAIRLLHRLSDENRVSTAEEQEILARYVGWGGLSDCFDENSSHYSQLKSLLAEAEYASARESTLTAFYTPPVVIRAMYQALAQMGFSHGNILEPACGIGNFIGLLPGSMAESKLYGVELDELSGAIARNLYQRSSISVRAYEKVDFPDNFFDVAIGNVPFGQFKALDRRYDRLNLPIHEYFIAKTLDKVRPGGVIAFVTSSFTMDKQTSKTRKYIAQRAELLGAIRLPNNTFKTAAGTEVTSDILFFQKRDRMTNIEPEWVNIATNDNGIRMNSYFIDHPDMILGEMKMVSGPYGPELTCVPLPGQDLETLMQNTVQNIQAQITDYELEEELDGEDKSIEADPSVRNFSYTLVDGVVYYRENSRMNPVEVSKTAESRIRGMIGLRDSVRALIEAQTEDYPDEAIGNLQADLNTQYDRFNKEYGLINSRGNSIAFSEDSSYFLLCSLEIIDEDGRLKRKADLFTKRTIRCHRPAEIVDTAVEALALSIGEKARVDMDYMSQLTGKDEEQLFADLTGVVFLNPNYVEGANDKYLPADEYLSGNVRKKLEWAKRSAQLYPEDYTANVQALEAVQPADLTASEISVRLGATWLKPDYYRQFIFETLATPRSAQWNIKVHYSKITGEWRIEGKSQDRGNVKAFNTYGTKRANAYEIIEDSLNLKDVRIFDYSYDADGKRTSVLNKKETAIAQSKQELLKEAFSEWLWKTPERREAICKAYNILFNSNRPREYDGSHITFSGMNPEIILRKHQVNAVAHIMYGGNTLLAHVVGAGKTFEMVAAAMESRRLGLCQKSLFVVPNHLTEQWATEFLQLYPAANILVATKKDFETKNRKRFCGRIATGDYDAVIIGHSQFEKIPVSVERQRAILEQQITEILFGIEEAKRERAGNFTVKQLEKTRKSLQLKMEKLNDQSRKDDVVTFEELGCDRLFIDESHFYKNLFLYTKMRNVGGIAQTEAQKSSDLFMKCRYLDELTGGRGIIFATGTPISNSMVELYTIQRYLQMNALQEQGMQHFDSWAANYGETVTAIELSPEGTGYRAKTRFAKFYNLPELMSTFKNTADIQTADMLKLPVPEAHYHNVALKPSDYQKDMVSALVERAERVRNRQVDSSVDNMLLITNDGRKLALDQRLINPMLPDEPNSKAAKCAENVFEIWQRTTEKRSTQMIFCDLSTPKGDETFSIYDDIRDKLLSMGVPDEQIAYIHNAKSEAQKKDLFSKVRAGHVRILLGSTQRMGAGTNCQQKLVALHHVDCPWRPSDLQQREGRIIRQGNENPEVDIYSYVTEGTFDAYLYQLVESKQKFISQIMTSKSPVRSAEDVDEQALSYAEIKALASGNPMIKEKMDLDIAVSKLKLLKSSHLSQRYALEDAISKTYPKEIAELKARLTGYGVDIAVVKENTHPNDDGFTTMILQDKAYTEKKEAGFALLKLCQNMLSPQAIEVGSYRGMTLELSFNSFAQEYCLTMVGKLRHPVTLGTDVFGNLQRLDNLLESLPIKCQTCEERLENVYAQLESAKQEVKRTFPGEEELRGKTARLEELNALLNMDHREPEFIDSELYEDAANNHLASNQINDRAER